jgi:hypothetical protein
MKGDWVVKQVRLLLASLLVVVMFVSVNTASAATSADVMAGYKAYKAKNYNEAINVLTCAINSGTLPCEWQAVAYTFRAMAYLKANCCDAAVADTTAAIALFKQYATPYYVRSLAYKCLNCPEQAAADMAMAMKLQAAMPYSPGMKIKASKAPCCGPQCAPAVPAPSTCSTCPGCCGPQL